MDAKPTFEDSISQLQEILDKLEQGALGLESVTELYEQGVALAANCRKLLEATESKIRLIQQKHGMPTDSDKPGGQ